MNCDRRNLRRHPGDDARRGLAFSYSRLEEAFERSGRAILDETQAFLHGIDAPIVRQYGRAGSNKMYDRLNERFFNGLERPLRSDVECGLVELREDLLWQ